MSNNCFKHSSFILAAILGIGIGTVPLAVAQQEAFRQGPYIIDTNTGEMTRIVSRPGGFTVARALNDDGQVAGTSFADGRYRGFITGPDGDGMKDLGTLGAQWSGGDWSFAWDINETGQVTGTSSVVYGESAFITGQDGDRMRGLGTINGNSTQGRAINDLGQVAVIYGSGGAFILGPDGVGTAKLGTLGGGYDSPTDINNAGQVVGTARTAAEYDPVSHAFMTGPHGEGIRDLGTLGGSYSMAAGINDSGQVIGTAETAKPGVNHAFITGPNGEGMRDLGTLAEGLGSEGFGINDAGQVVGQVVFWSPEAGRTTHGFITGPDGNGMTDLNSLVELPDGFHIDQARDINNVGQVLVTIVAEPESYAMLLAGLGLLGFMVRCRNVEKSGRTRLSLLKPLIVFLRVYTPLLGAEKNAVAG